MPPDASRLVEIIRCARCSGAHSAVEVRPFTVPVAPADLAPFQWTDWASCPTTGEPILVGKMTEVTPGAVLDAHAKNAYAAYGQSTGGKNFRGEPMPKWDELPPSIQAAWRASVDAVLR